MESTKRIREIDGLRGFFLVNMMIVHLNDSVTHARFWNYSYHKLGWVEDAQGFVFISGVMAGIIYGKTLLIRSAAAMKQGIFARTFKIYLHHATLVLALAATAIFFQPQLARWDHEWAAAPVSYTLLSLVLIDGPRYIDILPMYVIFMAFAPLVLLELQRGRSVEVMAGALLVWVISQTSLVLVLLDWLGDSVGFSGFDIHLHSYFYFCAWQVFFVSGLIVGRSLAAGQMSLSFLDSRSGKSLFVISAIAVLVFAATRWAGSLDHVTETTHMDFYDVLFERQNISALRIINFAADAYAFIWLLTRQGGFWPTRLISRVLKLIFNSRPLVFLGRHSLIVYSFHVVLIYTVYLGASGRILAMGQVERALVVLAAVLTLFLPALAATAFNTANRPRRRSAACGGAPVRAGDAAASDPSRRAALLSVGYACVGIGGAYLALPRLPAYRRKAEESVELAEAAARELECAISEHDDSVAAALRQRAKLFLQQSLRRLSEAASLGLKGEEGDRYATVVENAITLFKESE